MSGKICPAGKKDKGRVDKEFIGERIQEFS